MHIFLQVFSDYAMIEKCDTLKFIIASGTEERNLQMLYSLKFVGGIKRLSKNKKKMKMKTTKKLQNIVWTSLPIYPMMTAMTRILPARAMMMIHCRLQNGLGPNNSFYFFYFSNIFA